MLSSWYNPENANTSNKNKIYCFTINAKIFTRDSINYISAELLNSSTDSAIAGESLDVQIQRLFMSTTISNYG